MIPDFPRLKWPLDGAQLELLDKSIQQLKDLLTGRVETNQNTINQIVDIVFQAPNIPSKRLDGSTKPLGVLPLSLDFVDGASVAQTLPFQWSWAAGVLSVPSLGGIAGTKKYNLRVLIVRG